VTADGGLGFWLGYVESRGGLWEMSGDTALVMIPPQLQRRHELPEEFAVTAHPDVAREDGVALLEPGHPLLLAAAEDVLSADDAGLLRLAAPAAQPPGDDRLLEKAREAFPVGHGRIDASGPAERTLRQVLRVGAMVTYTASADDRFHERAECWLDVPSRHELPAQAAERLRRLATDGSAGSVAPDLAALPPALAAAHLRLDHAAAERCRVLASGSVRAAADAERARARTYYAEALASLARRQASAAPDRQALLAARMDSVRAEEQRRLAEIEEKYTPRHEIRPYRLHLVHVPALRLPVDVFRGTRRFPLVLEWLLPAGVFAPVSCPTCGADTASRPLVAAKTHLGCARCLPAAGVSTPATRAFVPPVAAVQAPGRGPGNGSTSGPAARNRTEGRPANRAGRPAARPTASAPTSAASRPAASASRPAAAGARPAPATSSAATPRTARPRPRNPQALGKTGEKLAIEFWSVAGQGNPRALRRLCAPDSPTATAVRLYGMSGPAAAVGMAAGERPESLTSDTSAFGDSNLAGTCGFVDTGRARYDYLLRWDPDTRRVAEVLPFRGWVSARLPTPRWLSGSGSSRMFDGLPDPDCELDPVAVRLWRKALPAHGLPLTLRCLAAWWRIGDGPELLVGRPPSVLAAAIHRMVGYRAGETEAGHDAIADLYRVAASQTRTVTPLLQARLRLSPQQPW
jgi:hypothetical protein